MVNFFKKLFLSGRVALCSAAVALGSAFEAAAQEDVIGTQILRTSTRTMSSLLVDIANVVKIALGIGALVTLVIVIYNLIKGEREAAQKIGYWVVGLALGFALIQVVVSVVTSNVGA